MEKIVHQAEEMAELAKNFGQRLKADKAQATVLALSGELGSGKTTFTQALARSLGAKGYITSPTFVLQKKYSLDKSAPFANLIHLDCYRLSGAEEIINLGWKELLADPKNLIVVEWPERIAEAIPAEAIRLDFLYIDEMTREVKMDIADQK